MRYSSTLSLTSVLDGGGWLSPRLGRLTPVKDTCIGGWVGLRAGAENAHPPTGIRSLDRPPRTESQYRLFFLSCSLFAFCPYMFLDWPGFCLYCTTHNTNIHAPGGIRTRNPSKRASVDRRLKPLGHWDRQSYPGLLACDVHGYQSQFL